MEGGGLPIYRRKWKPFLMFGSEPFPSQSSKLQPLLENYPNIEVAKELLQGFQFGFKLVYKGRRLGGDSKKKSVLQFPDTAKEKIITEVKFCRITGPFLKKPIPNQ